LVEEDVVARRGRRRCRGTADSRARAIEARSAGGDGEETADACSSSDACSSADASMNAAAATARSFPMPTGAQLPESLCEKWETLLETSSFAARPCDAYRSFLQLGDGILLETV
jgi:hypothetical protein